MAEPPEPVFRKIDSIQIPVPDLDAALVFYRDSLGHELVWRTKTAAGLRMPGTDAEIVLQTERVETETDLLVDSVDDAITRVVAVGGRVVVQPFDIAIGKCVVVEDPWGNRLVLLDNRNGSLVTDNNHVVQTDEQGNAIVRRGDDPYLNPPP